MKLHGGPPTRGVSAPKCGAGEKECVGSGPGRRGLVGSQTKAGFEEMFFGRKTSVAVVMHDCGLQEWLGKNCAAFFCGQWQVEVGAAGPDVGA